MSQRYGFSCVRVLPELVGKPWNDITKAYMRSLRPSRVRVVRDGDPVTSDAVSWRVTVYLTTSGSIHHVEQEVEVDLPDGVDHGHMLRCKMEDL